MKRAVVATLLLVPLLAGCTKDAGPDDALVWPFPEAKAPEGDTITSFVLWSQDAAAPADVDWTETHLGKDALGTVVLAAGDARGSFRTLALRDRVGPRFGLDGYNATQATLMVFNDEAELLATTGGLHEYAHLPWISDSLFEVDDAVYYLGDGDAPNGTQALPWFLEPFRPRITDLLHGLPVGGVSSVVVPEEDYRDAFGGTGIGTLYLTARVDALVWAP